MAKKRAHHEVEKKQLSPARPFDPTFLNKVGVGRTIARYRAEQVVFSQGDPAEAIFYIEEGKVQLRVVSPRGKEAVLALLTTRDFSAKDVWRANKYA